MTSRKYNFGAGPATMPTEVLLEVQEELLDWNGMGISVMEISHRGEFTKIAEEAESDFRDLLSIPENYAVLFTWWCFLTKCDDTFKFIKTRDCSVCRFVIGLQGQ